METLLTLTLSLDNSRKICTYLIGFLPIVVETSIVMVEAQHFQTTLMIICIKHSREMQPGTTWL